MATYGYRCAWCGPFERRANPRAAGAPAPCPTCGALCARTYDAPGGRSPRRARQLDGVGRPGRERIERAEAGVATAGAMPGGGARPHRGGAVPPPAPPGGPGRPWQVGH
ncbi:MAG TPA: FmdB family zinc ribbon protein [Solirubrobacteraceae bacterium]|nr:FmdB family zinc ribbon protein [Solirubrobacteraceae bacterium]